VGTRHARDRGDTSKALSIAIAEDYAAHMVARSHAAIAEVVGPKRETWTIRSMLRSRTGPELPE
jgi:hypothetical protein